MARGATALRAAPAPRARMGMEGHTAMSASTGMKRDTGKSAAEMLLRPRFLPVRCTPASVGCGFSDFTARKDKGSGSALFVSRIPLQYGSDPNRFNPRPQCQPRAPSAKVVMARYRQRRMLNEIEHAIRP